MWQPNMLPTPPGQHQYVKLDARIDPAAEQSLLTGLDMSQVRIRRFPHELCRFSFLTELRLDNNFIQQLPRDISKLRCLLFLDFSNNQLVELPPDLGKLTNLRELLLYNNLLTSLPPELGSLYNLEVLGVEGNPIMDPTLQQYMQHANSISIVPFLRDHVLRMPPRPI